LMTHSALAGQVTSDLGKLTNLLELGVKRL